MKRKNLKNVLVAGILALLFGCHGKAQQRQGGDRRQGPPSPKELIAQMDADEDGKLSKEEVKGPLRNDFDKVDLNEDGFLSLEELQKAPKPKRRDERN